MGVGVLGAAQLVAQIEEGQEPPEGETVRVLRSPTCPAHLIELLAAHRTMARSRRILPLLLRHPACPRPFAWDNLARLGWRDLLEVARAPRTAAPIRRQSERKLIERLPHLTAGERTALARLATSPIIAALLSSLEPRGVPALLDNPRFTESHALRLLACNENLLALLALVRHPRWGRNRTVMRGALSSKAIPLGVKIGIAVVLTTSDLGELSRAADTPDPLRAAAAKLLAHRRRAINPTD